MQAAEQQQVPEQPVGEQPLAAESAAESLQSKGEALREEARELLPGELGQREVWGISLAEALSLSALLIGLILLRLLADWLLNRLLPRPSDETPARTALAVRRAIGQVISLATFLTGLFVLLSYLPLGEAGVRALLWRIFLTLAIVLGGIILYRLVELAIALLHQNRYASASSLEQGICPLLRNTAKVVLAVVILIGIVEAWGYSAAGLLAGLGIGGLAIAFAAQDTFSNIFGSFIIYGDRPYKVGDWVKVKEFEGTVEDIGMRSTRIRTFENSLLTVPNRDVTTNTVENFTTRDQRRVKFLLGVLYSTPPEKIERLRDDLTAMLKARDDITDRLFGVRFSEFGESSLNILVSFCIAATDFFTYYRVREEVLLWILRYCNEHGIGIAFPTRSLWIENAALPVELAGDGRPEQDGRLEK